MSAEGIGAQLAAPRSGGLRGGRLLTLGLPLALGAAFVLPHLFDGGLQQQAMGLLRTARGHGGAGLAVVFLLRISPVMPFAVTSYALGLSAVRFRPYLLGTIASLLPLLAFVAMGRIAGFGATQLRAGNPVQWTALAIGGAATLGLAWYVMRVLRRSLADMP